MTPLRTVEQYKKSLNDGRKVYVVGARVQDVTTHPILKITIDHSHLIRDLTASEFGGYNQVLAIHAEGSLQAQMITMYRDYDIERCVDLVKKTLDIR